jgi:hypothetical protein
MILSGGMPTMGELVWGSVVANAKCWTDLGANPLPKDAKIWDKIKRQASRANCLHHEVVLKLVKPSFWRGVIDRSESSLMEFVVGSVGVDLPTNIYFPGSMSINKKSVALGEITGVWEELGEKEYVDFLGKYRMWNAQIGENFNWMKAIQRKAKQHKDENNGKEVFNPFETALGPFDERNHLRLNFSINAVSKLRMAKSPPSKTDNGTEKETKTIKNQFKDSFKRTPVLQLGQDTELQGGDYAYPLMHNSMESDDLERIHRGMYLMGKIGRWVYEAEKNLDADQKVFSRPTEEHATIPISRTWWHQAYNAPYGSVLRNNPMWSMIYLGAEWLWSGGFVDSKGPVGAPPALWHGEMEEEENRTREGVMWKFTMMENFKNGWEYAEFTSPKPPFTTTHLTTTTPQMPQETDAPPLGVKIAPQEAQQGAPQGAQQGATQEATPVITQEDTQGATQEATPVITQEDTQGATQEDTQGATQEATPVITQDTTPEDAPVITQEDTQEPTQQDPKIIPKDDPSIGTVSEKVGRLDENVVSSSQRSGTSPHFY